MPRPDWELPVRACKSVGGKESDALTVAASVACLQISIMLADDILDEDPRGAHNLLGPGQVANIALALQAASIYLIESSPFEATKKNQLLTTLAWAALATAYGQNIDARNIFGEEEYWKVVNAKSTPFYASALKLGAMAGGAEDNVCQGLFNLGNLIGEIIQLEDDLTDALAVPANPDWLQGRNNLLILYARTAHHEEKKQFEELLPLVSDNSALIDAQHILVNSGAVSYCIYLLVHRFHRSMQQLNTLSLPNPAPLEEILFNYAQTLLALLKPSGLEVTVEDLLSPSFPGSN